MLKQRRNSRRTEVNKEASISLTLIWRQDHDAWQIVLLLTVFLLEDNLHKQQLIDYGNNTNNKLMLHSGRGK